MFTKDYKSVYPTMAATYAGAEVANEDDCAVRLSVPTVRRYNGLSCIACNAVLCYDITGLLFLLVA